MLWENQMLDLCETWPDLPHYSSFINIITEIAMKYISSLPGHFIYQNKSHFCDFHMLEIRGSNGPICNKTWLPYSTHILPRIAKYELICSNRTEDMNRWILSLAQYTWPYIRSFS